MGTTNSKNNLRSRGSILLISCYELGHQPLGIASPMAFLERAGYKPQSLDISVERFEVEKIARARFVGISVPMHTALRLGVRLAERIREINSDCHICFYGLYALLNAEYLLESRQVGTDSVIGGEFEEPLVSLIDALDAGRSDEIRGVARRGKKTGPYLERLNFPLPSRNQLPPIEKYARLEWNGTRSLVGYVEASRGCLHHCLHCPIPPVYGGRFFVVPKEIVLEDIRRLVGSGARHITFGDPDFLNGPTHSLRIVRAMHDEFPELTFDFTAKIEHILKNRSIFSELDKLGCIFMISAVESLSDTVLANLEKGHTRADAIEALNIVREAGIAFRPTWVAFTPWTTLDDYIDMLEFVREEGLIDSVDPVQYTIRLLIPPGSALLSARSDPWSDRGLVPPKAGRTIQPFIGELDQAAFYYRWKHSDPRMDLLHNEVRLVVKEAAQKNEDTATTFNRIRPAAYAACGDLVPVVNSYTPLHERNRPPRLTEPWFCCAEPTDDQFRTVVRKLAFENVTQPQTKGE